MDDISPFAPEMVRRVSRRLPLPSGRHLGIAEFGPAGAPAVLYFHGFPSSRLEPAILGVDGTRIIGIDRPGYGLSDGAPGRRLADWPGDIAALTDALDLPRFAVFGMSGGAPYAAAVAAALPDRVTALALVSGLGPPEAPGMTGRLLGLLRGFGAAPLPRHVVFGLVRQLLLSDQGETRVIEARRRFRARGARDTSALTDEFSRRLIACWREGLRVSVEGAASDARIYGEPWSFSAGDIRAPTQIWHGEADPIVPASIARHYAGLIPHARTRFLPDEGHVSLIAYHYQEILDALLSSARQP